MEGVCWRRFVGGGGGGGAEKSPFPKRTPAPEFVPEPGGAGGMNAWPPVGPVGAELPLPGADDGKAVTVASGIKGCLGCGRAKAEVCAAAAAAADCAATFRKFVALPLNLFHFLYVTATVSFPLAATGPLDDGSSWNMLVVFSTEC
uniref:Uncharacterized protein n=1 Tax=Glossina brevipalpis TaxID=37001 RepID=A0A1A9WHR5_9MUSC